MDISYATLTQVKRQWVKENTANVAAQDPIMADFARRASGTIDREVGMEFAPRIETRTFDLLLEWDKDNIDNRNRTFYMDGNPLVDVTAVTLADGATPTVDTEVRMFKPGSQKPSLELQLSQSSTNTWTQTSGTDFDDIEITGIWCWRDRYDSDGFLDSGDTVQDNPLSSSATEVTVTDADGADYYSDTPRFDVGQLIRIESEFLAITGVNTTTNKLTVVRGVRGSTAAAHVQTTQIDAFFPQPDIVRATQLIAMYNLARRGRIDRATFDGLQVTTLIEIPIEAQVILDKYKFGRFG
ncbi:MAG: hypothetical protein ACYTBJ_25445 [Planctomycetota bacterium]|jgi:hypothetical protein